MPNRFPGTLTIQKTAQGSEDALRSIKSAAPKMSWCSDMTGLAKFCLSGAVLEANPLSFAWAHGTVATIHVQIIWPLLSTKVGN